MITTQNILYERDYPLHRTIRIRHSTLDRIKARNEKYGESVDYILNRILKQLEQYEKRGFEVKEKKKESKK
jgi:hypothetical protein